MDAFDRIINLLNYAALLSEQGAPETPERMSEINKAVMEAAHEVRKGL